MIMLWRFHLAFMKDFRDPFGGELASLSPCPQRVCTRGALVLPSPSENKQTGAVCPRSQGTGREQGHRPPSQSPVLPAGGCPAGDRRPGRGRDTPTQDLTAVGTAPSRHCHPLDTGTRPVRKRGAHPCNCPPDPQRRPGNPDHPEAGEHSPDAGVPGGPSRGRVGCGGDERGAAAVGAPQGERSRGAWPDPGSGAVTGF